MDENQQCIGVWGGGDAVGRWQQPPMFQVFDVIIIIIIIIIISSSSSSSIVVVVVVVVIVIIVIIVIVIIIIIIANFCTRQVSEMFCLFLFLVWWHFAVFQEEEVMVLFPFFL